MPPARKVLPDWLLRQRPSWHEALRTNQQRLVTVHELYLAMQQLAAWPEPARKPSGRWPLSIFDKLPAERTCEEAGIPEIYCACRAGRT